MQYIDRFGADAILGRKLYAREVRRVLMAENVVTAHRSHEQAKNGAEWARDNPDLSRILNEARKLKQELYGDE